MRSFHETYVEDLLFNMMRLTGCKETQVEISRRREQPRATR